MKRMVLMALLAMALPLAAFAGSVDLGNGGGLISGSSAGLSLTGSELITVGGLGGGGLVQGLLGSVAFTTGALMPGGSLTMGGDFNGGTFTVTGNGTNGIPDMVLFSGAFTSPVKWSLNTLSDGTHQYTLQGTIKGTWYNGKTVVGLTYDQTVNTGKGLFGGSVNVISGETGITTVPEPGTLGLLGTGMLGLAGALHRKLKG
jgi:hypothetical protein